MDPDPDPAIFVIDLQDAKKLAFLTNLLKSQREAKKQKESRFRFSYYFCLMMRILEGQKQMDLTDPNPDRQQWQKDM